MTNTCKAVCFSTVLLMACGPLALAQGTYSQIDVPGSLATLCYGIDTAGDIVGTYADATGFAHGFLLIGGTYTTIDYPGAQTQLFGVNDVGQIVGYTISNPVVGFLYDVASQTFTTISHAGATNTYPVSINDSATIAGYFTYGNGAVSGFELIGTTYRLIKPPGASNSYVYGISTAGEVAGYVPTIQLTRANFLFKHGKYQRITIPTNGDETTVFGINGAGTALVGVYQPTLGTSVGFFYQSKVLQELKFPAASNTFASGVNNSGEVVGYFYDSSFNIHGFTWVAGGASKK